MEENQNLPEFASVSDVARMMGLSRQRFYQLMQKGLVPPPLHYDNDCPRPYYDRNLQQLCLEVRRRNRGINGKPILFYSPRSPMAAKPRKPSKAKPKGKSPKADSKFSGVAEALHTLGVETTAAEVKAVVAELFPEGVADPEDGDVLRSVFRHLRNAKGKNTDDKVG